MPVTMHDSSEILDIEQATARWEEIMDRVERGKVVTIMVDGVPKARLEPITSASLSSKCRSVWQGD
jgi:prevent-host-death family protein